MSQKKIVIERDREATEQKLIDTIGRMIAESGFEKIGVNAVANQSGVSKILIYRYFGSIDGLITAYIKQHDFWINYPIDIPIEGNVVDYLKRMFREQIIALRKNPALKRLYRWELYTNNEMIAQLREQREKAGIARIEKFCEVTGYSPKNISVMATVLTASIAYLALLEEFCPAYNGIAINQDSGWEQICDGIDLLIEKVLNETNSGQSH